jgi:hypothetical protein
VAYIKYQGPSLVIRDCSFRIQPADVYRELPQPSSCKQGLENSKVESKHEPDPLLQYSMSVAIRAEKLRLSTRLPVDRLTLGRETPFDGSNMPDANRGIH